MTLDSDVFDPDFLSRLRTLFFKLRKRYKLTRKGIQRTVSTGHTKEFKDHRHYVRGDDYRQIDWHMYARHDKLFIRVFQEIQEFHVHIILDRSMSMIRPYSAKRLTALRAAVALAYLALVNQHRVSILSMADSIEREIKPLKGQGHIYEVIRILTSLDFGGTTDLKRCLSHFRPARDRKGIIFLISDLFGKTVESSVSALRETIAWPAETHVIHVIDPEEGAPDLEGEVNLQDVESGEIRKFSLSRKDMNMYAEMFSEFLENVRKTCASSQINYMTWNTTDPFEEMFTALLSKGSGLAGS